MKKKVPVVSVAEVETATLAGLGVEATVALSDVAGAVKDGLLGFCADVGLMVMAQMLDAEMTARVGPKHAKIPGREANWHGTTTGPVVLGGRQVSVSRPRGRTVAGEEIELEAWQAFSSKDLLDRLTVERMLAGVATRRHVDVAEPLSAEVGTVAKATGRSSVSRRFKRATEAALAELMARDLSDLEVAVIMIDGLAVAGHCVVVALAITGGWDQGAGRVVARGHREQDRGDRPARGSRRPGPVRRRRSVGRAGRGQGPRRRSQEGLR